MTGEQRNIGAELCGRLSRIGLLPTDPVAWLAFAVDGSESSAVYMTRGEARAAADEYNWCIAPLYRSPTLTDAEREAIERAADWLCRWQEAHGYHSEQDGDLTTLRGLLERTR